MSGGVDSTACALMLTNRYNIEGFFMHLAQPDFSVQKQRVQEIASRLGIKLHVIDLRRQFEEKVLTYFSRSYFDGLTPNPCMICNREIKFGLLLEKMLSLGMDAIATGHYARIMGKDGSLHLMKGRDPNKDQSYFLAHLTREQLSRVFFPLGDMTKEETYVLAEQNGFMDFRGRESQDVCFLGKDDLGDFLQERFPNACRPGPIRTNNGQTLGSHKGLFRYTVGQRRGLGLPHTSPWYVLALEVETNTIVVGKEEDLYKDSIVLTKMNWPSGSAPPDGKGFQVKIRYTHRGAEAHINQLDKGKYRITFKEKQRAVTPGQFAVIFRNSEVIGSGVILKE